ncbi:MAG: imidazoleglycerol-phosphate dehydratase HisB [Chloroflexi bacterium]|nr:imidazoleglycerol-phosphate dehydratase HisB [Chloroflexota bacterium]MYB22759.1 imidazoleglycerol-phosphate dehydratase HisB [Chloroflexota bacterium]MYD15604.1 imidazoleglycerol-phosphate dehydratase HisB [Chloroflexota bacterium]MYF81152.1 imidazoleglycerol-phosphate dehydratase HisB [Chloroflexota bacterium]MYI03774.1 imidazoleglycerol-phosphate dehydratase HisB [Chloroflexota bacterium]
MRSATVTRDTGETSIRVELELDGSGRADVSTGVGMLDHMLHQLARHGAFDLSVQASGDLHVDAHHTSEDVAIAVGRALDDALGDRAGIARFADRTVPLDESLIQVALDLSGRPYAAIDLNFPAPMIGELPSSMARHILETVAHEGRLALHVRQLAGENEHHIIEATFKALARCLRDAVRVVEESGAPSTKGTLSS